MRDEGNSSAMVRGARWGGMWGVGGGRRPRSKSAVGNREVQSKRDITLSKTGCYDPLSSTSLLFHLLISQFLFPQ